MTGEVGPPSAAPRLALAAAAGLLLAASTLHQLHDARGRAAVERFFSAFTLDVRRPEMLATARVETAADLAMQVAVRATALDVAGQTPLAGLSPSLRETWLRSVRELPGEVDAARGLALEALAARPAWAFHALALAGLVLADEWREPEAERRPEKWLAPVRLASAWGPGAAGAVRHLGRGRAEALAAPDRGGAARGTRGPPAGARGGGFPELRARRGAAGARDYRRPLPAPGDARGVRGGAAGARGDGDVRGGGRPRRALACGGARGAAAGSGGDLREPSGGASRPRGRGCVRVPPQAPARPLRRRGGEGAGADRAARDRRRPARGVAHGRARRPGAVVPREPAPPGRGDRPGEGGAGADAGARRGAGAAAPLRGRRARLAARRAADRHRGRLGVDSVLGGAGAPGAAGRGARRS